MSLREKTISGAKWSAIATVIIIGLGLVQMTVLARIIDNHQFGLLTVSLVIIALADTLSDFGIANSIIQRKEISHLELTTLYWLNVGLGLVVCVAVFLLSDLIGDVLNNPDLAPLIKTLSLAFVVIPHGQQFRALMQKELEFNKIGMIETSAVLAGFTFTVVSAHFWPLAMTAILGYLVNSAVRTLLFGDPVAGWPSMACILFLVSGVQLFCTGIVGIYLSKTYLETKHRPIYLLKETSEETVKMHSVQPVKKQESAAKRRKDAHTAEKKNVYFPEYADKRHASERGEIRA